MELLKKQADLNKKLEDPEYSIFYGADQSKDDLLTFDELLVWLKSEDPDTLEGES